MENLIISVVPIKINQKITVEPLFKNYKKMIHLFIYRNSEVILLFERNDAGLKKLLSFV
jgi:hypothetical protein